MKHKPPIIPGTGETPEMRELREQFEREFEETKRADGARIKELELQVRRLKSDLRYRDRILAKTGGHLHELEIEREERLAGRKRA
jgi:hypothetical protein